MGVLKRRQTLLGKEGIGRAFARGQRVRDRWNSFLEVTLVSRIELHSVRAIGLGDRPVARRTSAQTTNPRGRTDRAQAAPPSV